MQQQQEPSHRPLEWASLRDIDHVPAVGIDSNDDECLAEIGAILEKYQKTERFGIALLHKHFELDNDEVLMEFCDTANRTLTTRSVKVSEVGNSIETVWNFPDRKTTRVCYRRCWTNVHGNHETDHNYST